jgi:hypothetical protein
MSILNLFYFTAPSFHILVYHVTETIVGLHVLIIQDFWTWIRSNFHIPLMWYYVRFIIIHASVAKMMLGFILIWLIRLTFQAFTSYIKNNQCTIDCCSFVSQFDFRPFRMIAVKRILYHFCSNLFGPAMISLVMWTYDEVMNLDWVCMQSDKMLGTCMKVIYFIRLGISD